MQPDFEGFMSPVIDFVKCVDCGLCSNCCPQINDADLYSPVNYAYGVICDDEIREKSSSGGVFGAIGKWAIQNGGSVFGAAYTDDFRNIHHIEAKSEEELLKLCKSKYFQCSTETIYPEVKKALKSEKPVVFSGCPCQVAALRKYLKKDYDNLVTIDILCHGVVSPKAYQLFLDEMFGDVSSPISRVDFRPKEKGWSCNIIVEAEDGTKRISSYHQSYFNAFLWGYSQRKACFNCKYAKSERISDITIGDFWGINDIDTTMNDEKGTSLVLCNTPKGETAINNIKPYISKIKKYDYSDVIKVAEKVNWALIKPGIEPEKRDVFFYRLAQGDKFSQALRYASSPKYDVGIFGWWFEDDWTNYGSTLTYYALMEYVSSLGLSVCMLTSPYHKKEQASKFVKSHGYVISKTYKFEEFGKHNENIDTFLIGSDQLWFYDCYKKWGHSLFLDFANDDKKKIAYATSFGHKDPKIPNEELPKVKKLLKRFDAVSSRENDGVKILKDKFDIDAVQTLDPVFLCDMKNWDAIAEESERKTEEKFIFTYMLDPTSEKIKALEYLKTKLNLKVVSITDKQYDHENKEKMLEDYCVLRNATINELIYHLKNAAYIVTDSYHGTCFSLLFRKNFVSIINSKRGTSRFETLAVLFDVADRFVYSANEIIENPKLLSDPDYSLISAKIDKETMRSKAWLSDKLLSFKKNTVVKDQSNANHSNIIKDFNILNQLGYNVGRYLKDIGIDTFSVYCEQNCLDIFECFLTSLNIDAVVNVTGFYSEKAFMYKYNQSINFGCAYFQEGIPTSGVVIYVNDNSSVKEIKGCKVLNLLTLMWQALSYASIFRPLVHYKNEYPDINILIVNYPVFPPDDRRDNREEFISTHKNDYFYNNLVNQIPKTFSAFKEKNYSDNEWVELFSAAHSEIDINGKRKYLDLSSKLVNIKDGHRVVKNQPQESKKTVFLLGGCMTYGYGCADDETSAYYLQELMNKEGYKYSIENYGAFLNYRRKDMYQILFDLPAKSGDIIVVEVWRNIPDICRDYFDIINLREIFYRPHNYGDVFLDNSHLSYCGQKVVAEKIFKHLKKCSFYNDAPIREIENKVAVEPLNLFGIPKDQLSDTKDRIFPELQNYLDSIKYHKPRIGAIVMNCNPFTLGHRYLIETAAKQCLKLYVFVVEEDKSVFKFEDRIELVRKGTADIENVTVLPSGKFMISSLTFTDYFNKSEIQDKQIDPSMDVEIFAKYIAPALGINVRFAGEEPLDKVTKQYNDTMRRILPQHDIEFIEIPRKSSGDKVISASLVRQLLDDKNFEAISKLVPETTLNFLKNNYDRIKKNG